MDFESTVTEIVKLPVADRLAIVQRVLDSIAGEMETEEIEFSPAFRAELDRRIADDIANPHNAIPWETIEAESAAKEVQ
jgi:putative addiction module component (TIGR02574 family)